MKIYMFQKTEENVNDYDYEFYTDEELFYKYEDAVKYLEEIYELKIEDIEELFSLIKTHYSSFMYLETNKKF